ncbi:MAG TPA: DNA methyltransferase [Chloroflexota bacterium]|nr:DNA methyltransferase [Chloroflexota bacterium]
MSYATARRRDTNADLNKLYSEDRAVHEWYRFVLSFPPHLVREYVDRFQVGPCDQVLDPFCGTGTVAVECKKLGVGAVGIEANPMAHFASTVKTDWSPDPDELMEHARSVADDAYRILSSQGIEDNPAFSANDPIGVPLRGLDAEENGLLLTNSVSPLPLHKLLILLDCLKQRSDDRFYRHEVLAFAKSAVYSASNLHFGPEVGVGLIRSDAPVIDPWLACVRAMTEDLRSFAGTRPSSVRIIHGDSRQATSLIEPASVDAVITSPPYPNEKDYTRTTRLESVLLGFIRNKADLRALKKGMLRSNTRGVYQSDADDQWVSGHAEVQRLALEIERRRIELGKTSGFERMYARVTKLYFGGMARHLAELRTLLRPGAHLAYVVGDQASYLRVMIRTGQILADIAASLGYEVESIDLFRTRLATATREQLREEVVVLRWPRGQEMDRTSRFAMLSSQRQALAG